MNSSPQLKPSTIKYDVNHKFEMAMTSDAAGMSAKQLGNHRTSKRSMHGYETLNNEQRLPPVSSHTKFRTAANHILL